MLKLKLQYFGHLMWRADSLEKTLMLGGIGSRKKGATEDEMAGWHHWLSGCEFEWTPGVGDGQGGLACCSSWGHKESNTTERLNWTEWLVMLNIFPCAFPIRAKLLHLCPTVWDCMDCSLLMVVPSLSNCAWLYMQRFISELCNLVHWSVSVSVLHCVITIVL